MVSISDGEDMHFRKAKFDSSLCIDSCKRPCEDSCPANAITTLGVIEDKCYGCGRCLCACPINLINTIDHSTEINEIGQLLSKSNPDAIEIHTAPGRNEKFEIIVKSIMKSNITPKRIAVSSGLHDYKINHKQLADELWMRFLCLRKYDLKPIWQLDGRPMSGDLGKATAKSSIYLMRKMQAIIPPGPIQLAGGTNSNTIDFLEDYEIPDGIAFGSVARKIIQPYIDLANSKQASLLDCPEILHKALDAARSLIDPWLKRA
tara:strand:- start:6554 stop:7336 length:783 start_codon:yes stop_codon:yes gene_type:complete